MPQPRARPQRGLRRQRPRKKASRCTPATPTPTRRPGKSCGAYAMKPASTAGAGRSAAGTSTPGSSLPRRAGGHRHADAVPVHRLPHPVQPGHRVEADRHALDRREPARGRRHHGQAADAGAPQKGMPESLIRCCHLAALADVRMLVFDADAQVLDGLPIYDE